MSRLLLFALVLLLIVPPAAFAQTIRPYDDGCAEPAISEIDSKTLDYRAACAVFRACDPYSQGDFLCQFRAADVLLQQCPADAAVCQKLALLYAAAILAYDMPFGEALGWRPAQSIREGVPRALAAAEAGDYATALSAYQMTPFDAQSGETMLPFSRGVVDDLMGDSASALAEYESAFSINFNHPLVWYARSQLYGALGRLDEASFDAAALLEYARQTPELNTLTTALAERYPLRVEEWLRYPLIDQSDGPAGHFFRDLTLVPPEPIQIGIFDELDSLVAVGVSNQGSWQDNSSRAVQVLKHTSSDSYHLSYPAIWENAGGITITRYPEAMMSQEFIAFFEGAARWQFMLAPAGAPDPRAGLDGARHCPGSVLSWVKIGMSAQTPYYGGDDMIHYDAPGGAQIGAGTKATIIGGPECVGTVTWWQAQDETGNRFWTPENKENQYQINPDAVWDVTPFYCPNASQTRLFVGGSGSVIPGLGANNIRGSAGLKSESIGTLAEGDTFTVTAGPVCVDSLVWWQVESQGISGWTAEGDGDVYWLEPGR
jgi:tetratricopeptide (TPR) repeat protein